MRLTRVAITSKHDLKIVNDDYSNYNHNSRKIRLCLIQFSHTPMNIYFTFVPLPGLPLAGIPASFTHLPVAESKYKSG